MKCYCGKRNAPNPQNASHVRDGHSLCSAACARAYDLTAGVVISAIIEGGHTHEALLRLVPQGDYGSATADVG